MPNHNNDFADSMFSSKFHLERLASLLNLLENLLENDKNLLRLDGMKEMMNLIHRNFVKSLTKNDMLPKKHTLRW